MTIKLLTEHHLEFLSLKGGCTGLSEFTHVKTPHCCKSHVVAQLCRYIITICIYTTSIPLIILQKDVWTNILWLTLNAPIATKGACFTRLLKCLRSLYGKQCGPRSDCSYDQTAPRSSLFWVHAVCFYTNSSVKLGIFLQQTTSADVIFRCIFLDALRVKSKPGL